MKRLLLLIALCLPLVAQQVPPQRNAYVLIQGQTAQIPNTAGSQSVSFEYLFDVTPASVSITIQGCMRGKDGSPGAVGTCDTAVDTYTGTSNSVRSPTFSKVYDTFLITAGTLSAGTKLTVNTTVVVSKAGTGSGGSGTIGGTLATGGNPGPIPYVSAANTLSEDTNICINATTHRLYVGVCSSPSNDAGIAIQAASGATFNGLSVTNSTSNVGAQIEITHPGATHPDTVLAANGTSGLACTNDPASSFSICNQTTGVAIGIGTNSTNRVLVQPGGEVDIGTQTAAGAAILLNTNGDTKAIHKIAGGTAPTITSGAGTGPSIAGADESGTITVGTTPGNSIVVALGQSYTNVPTCSATDTSSSPVFVQCVGGTSSITLNGIAFSTGAAANFTAGHVITWVVGGH